LKSFIAHLQSSAINRLLQIFTSQDAESMRHSRLLRRLPNPTRNFVHDHIVVRRVPANQASEADDSVVFLSFRQRTRSRRNFERSRHANNFYISFTRARTHQPVVRTPQQPVSNKFVEPGNNNSEAKS